ncbi:MAG: hypothetical protein PF961_15860 [Planctomycetota bacterium]|jgi:hypothetical protein|nr:hypothetical protein [Planctomycetota bacterium]
MRSLLLVIIAVCCCPAAQAFELFASAKPVPNGGTYHQPMNNASSSVALFSEQRDLFSIRNTGDTDLTIASITLTEAEGVIDEEFTLQDAALKPAPLSVSNVTVAPGKFFDFYVRFYPVHSGVRTATVAISYGDGQTHSITVSGKGRDKATFFSNGNLAFQQIYGGPTTDEQATGMVADGAGHVYLVGHVTQVIDRFAYDILVTKATTDGKLVWSKMWSGPFRDYTRDCGQNDQTGGSADAVAVDADGNLYIAGAVSSSKGNNDYAAFVMKVTPDGAIAWEQQWRPEWPSSLLAKHGAQAYGLRVAGDRVYVTGSTGAARSGAESHVFVLAMHTTDGALAWQKAIDPTPGSNDRGYTVAVHDDYLIIGGSANNSAFLARLDGLADPKVAWINKISAGSGSNINSIDIDPEGAIYAACDVRGMNCTFSLLKVAPDGQALWGKTYVSGRANQNNNTHIVRAIGDDVFAGGRIAEAWMDGQMGDGLITRIGSDGSLKWAAYYFTGKGPDEIQETRIKGLALDGTALLCFGQLYTGNNNGVRYHGYWYNGLGTLEAFNPSFSPIAMTDEQCFHVEAGAGKNASDITKQRQWVDTPSTLIWQDATAKHDGHGPDEDWFLMRLNLH